MECYVRHTIVKLLDNKPAILNLRLLCLNFIYSNRVPIPKFFPELLLDYNIFC
jgi:hypothetical protein